LLSKVEGTGRSERICCRSERIAPTTLPAARFYKVDHITLTNLTLIRDLQSTPTPPILKPRASQRS